MKDLETKEDIAWLIDSFYKKVVVDPVIGHFFNDVVKLSWEEHIPVMNEFWTTVLFGEALYKGNPMIKHIALNKLRAMEPQHFERWLSLWERTVNENFAGEKATMAINRAQSIAYIMQTKIKNS